MLSVPIWHGTGKAVQGTGKAGWQEFSPDVPPPPAQGGTREKVGNKKEKKKYFLFADLESTVEDSGLVAVETTPLEKSGLKL